MQVESPGGAAGRGFRRRPHALGHGVIPLVETVPVPPRRRRTRRLVLVTVTILLGAFAPYTRVLAVFRDHLQEYLGIGLKLGASLAATALSGRR